MCMKVHIIIIIILLISICIFLQCMIDSQGLTGYEWERCVVPVGWSKISLPTFSVMIGEQNVPL